jgi:hypothetical protein
MSLILSLTEAEEAVLAAKARARGTTPEALVREVIEPLFDTGSEQVGSGERPTRSIAETIVERMKSLPPAVFERLPNDGASEHDHYLYGSPKRNG